MWHTAAYLSNIANVANTQVNALAETILRIDGNSFMPPVDMFLVAAYIQAATIRRGNLQSPKIVQTNPLFIRPVNLGAAPLTFPSFAWYGPNYLRVRGQEDLAAYATGANASPETCIVGIWLAPSVDPMPAGEIYTIYATSTTACVSNVWTPLTVVLQNALPAGTYVMVGSQHASPNGVLHRWTFSNQTWRPGMISGALETDKPALMQLLRQLGPMGSFMSFDFPRLEVLASGTDAVHNIFLDLVKIA